MNFQTHKSLPEVDHSLRFAGYTLEGLSTTTGALGNPIAILTYEKGPFRIHVSTYVHGAAIYALQSVSSLDAEPPESKVLLRELL